jgi:hypothetical protein
MTQLALNYADPAAVMLRSYVPAHLMVVSSFSETEDDWIAEVEDRLSQLVQLPTGWDGYRSQRVSPATARFVSNLLVSVMKGQMPAPSIVPVSGGGLQVEWHAGGLDIELYVAKPMQAELSVCYADGRPALERELTSDFRLLSSVLDELA